MSHTVYIVGTVLPQPTMSEDAKPNLSVLGCFNELQEAKGAIDANKRIVENNPDTSLTIYKVNLGDNIHYSFHKSDLQGTTDKLQAAAPSAASAKVNPTPQQNAPQKTVQTNVDQTGQQGVQQQQDAVSSPQTQQKAGAKQPQQTAQQNAQQKVGAKQPQQSTQKVQSQPQQTSDQGHLSAAEQQEKALKQQGSNIEAQ